MRKTIVRWTLILAVVLLPFVVHWLYLKATRFPVEIAIASGPEGGRYGQIATSLADQVESKLGVRVRVIPTSGSLENLRLLDDGAAQFCLYQPRTEHFLRQQIAGGHAFASFVANVYTEIVHFAVRHGSEVASPQDLRGRRVSLGTKESGDYAMSRVLLEHFGLTEDSIEPAYLNYTQIKEQFADGTLDAAFLTLGVQAPILRQLFATGECDVLQIPYAEALSQKDVSISMETIPAGFYRSHSPVEPATDVATVGLRAQLLARTDVPSSFVEEVTRILLSEDFLKRNGLVELFTEGLEFAVDKQEFTPHPGTVSIYEPQLKPLLNPDFVEATEGMRSFIVSLLIAAFLGYRWIRRQHERRQEHRLDRYIQRVLEIEERQIALDARGGSEDIDRLRALLDEVARLRQRALSEFSAHELNEDRATDCFLEMTHALSDKINAKLTRQRFDKRLDELSKQLGASRGTTSQ